MTATATPTPAATRRREPNTAPIMAGREPLLPESAPPFEAGVDVDAATARGGVDTVNAKPIALTSQATQALLVTYAFKRRAAAAAVSAAPNSGRAAVTLLAPPVPLSARNPA